MFTILSVTYRRYYISQINLLELTTYHVNTKNLRRYVYGIIRTAIGGVNGGGGMFAKGCTCNL